jgi:hypothetical protein
MPPRPTRDPQRTLVRFVLQAHETREPRGLSTGAAPVDGQVGPIGGHRALDRPALYPCLAPR